MNIKVICKKCDHMFSWDLEKPEEKCPYCYADITAKDVRMTALEYKKYLQFSKTHRSIDKPEVSVKHVYEDAPQRYAASKQPEDTKTEEDIKGKFIIKKGKTKYGTIEITDPDYMILKLSIWAMGPQQKYIIRQLNKRLTSFLTETGFELEKSS